jgi:hypothetical protein
MLGLKLGEVLRQYANGAVVDQSHRAHHKGFGCADRRPHEPVTNQITKSCATILVPLSKSTPADRFVERIARVPNCRRGRMLL